MDQKPPTRVLSGIQPTGPIHWGNYFGAVRQYIDLQHHGSAAGGAANYFVADLHALTTVRDAALLRDYVRDAAVTLLALGLNPDEATLFVQSDVPEIPELTWLLMTVTPMPMLENCHAYKEKQSRGVVADAGLFTYPVLMAADILAYDSTLVPVGQDQKQHIEVTRDLAGKFNALHRKSFGGDVFVLPEPYILDASAKVIGTDGEKMSKSYDNTIPVFDTPKRLRKKIMGITTDSLPVEAEKDPFQSSIYHLFCLFASEEEQHELASRYRGGGMGYGEAKQALLDKSQEHFAAAVERRTELLEKPDEVDQILAAGAVEARKKAGEVLARAREAAGLPATPR